MLAAVQGHIEEMELLLSNKANPNLLERVMDTFQHFICECI